MSNSKSQSLPTPDQMKFVKSNFFNPSKASQTVWYQQDSVTKIYIDTKLQLLEIAIGIFTAGLLITHEYLIQL